ncbi:unnamed protein product [Leptosia nina]|uniref:Major facilitator superfamily (MFS) profile domain-containing protein n=1 Tax=Leptosia nina TaxID=320188 RepID=A0AAV1J1V4_9NEOP
MILRLIYTPLTSVKESPVYLLRNIERRAHYKGGSIDSKALLEEFSLLKQRLQPAVELIPSDDTEVEKAEKEVFKEDTEPEKRMSSFKMLFVSPSSRRGFTVVASVISLQVMMGMVPVQVYAKDIFSQAAPSLSSHLCSVLFALVLMAGSMSAALFSDKLGRKPLLITSAIAVGACLVSMGFFMQTNIAPPAVTAILILLYCFAFMLGTGTVPYILLAEVFVSEVQSLASMILMEWVWLLNFFILAIFPYMVQFLGIHGSFYCFAIFAVFDVLVAVFMVPETNGLTKEQIQEAFLGRRKK